MSEGEKGREVTLGQKKMSGTFLQDSSGARVSNPLIADELQLGPIGFVEPLRAGIAAAQELSEKALGLVFDLLFVLSHADSGGVKIVFQARQAQGFLSCILADQVGQLLIEHPD